MPFKQPLEVLRWRLALKAADLRLGPGAPPRGSSRPLPLAAWMLGLGLVVVGILALNYYQEQTKLIDELHQVEPVDEVAIAEARNDILRHTLTATAGFAGAAVLLLNFQKQRHEEYNATQQRIADLRIQAVEQLGSDSASVRIGGLHNLERLGESHPELRQIVLDEIGAYLRLGRCSPVPSEGAEPEQTPVAPGMGLEEHDRREVRLVAQEILQRHLKFRTAEQRRRYWSHGRLNLRNAVFEGFDFSESLLTNIDLTGATFHGPANFGGSVLKESADLRNTAFAGEMTFAEAVAKCGITFERSVFKGSALFHAARFEKEAVFPEAQFNRTATFADAQFKGPAVFDAVRFEGFAGLRTARFEDRATFVEARFGAIADFWEVRFEGHTTFREARFGFAAFQLARFGKGVSFQGVRFEDGTAFQQAEFGGGAVFREARFEDKANFQRARFEGEAHFEKTKFQSDANFSDARFEHDPDFKKTIFGQAVIIEGRGKTVPHQPAGD